MEKFIKFSDWETKRFSSKVEEDSTKQQPTENATKEHASGNAELIAQLAQVTNDRKEAVRNKEDFQAQILDIEIKLLKLEIERNDLVKKKTDLEAAKQLSLTTNKEAKTNVKEL
jgi:hypothetical protein